MPNISSFYGIIVWMFKESSQHKSPHVHCEYNEYKASFDFDGKLLSGNLPPKQTKLVVAWISIHEEELMADWKLLEKGENPPKIRPLD